TVGIFSETSDAVSFARAEQLFVQAGYTPRVLGLRDDWEGVSLLVLVWPVIPAARHAQELNLSQKLATYYLGGGRVIMIGLRGAGALPAGRELEIWDKLAHYFWDIGLRDISGSLEDSDHRALFFPGVSNLGSPATFRPTLEKLLAATDTLPATIPADDFG